MILGPLLNNRKAFLFDRAEIGTRAQKRKFLLATKAIRISIQKCAVYRRARLVP